MRTAHLRKRAHLPCCGARGLHFSLVAMLVVYFGAPAKRYLEVNFLMLALILLALLLGGLFAFRYVP